MGDQYTREAGGLRSCWWAGFERLIDGHVIPLSFPAREVKAFEK
jgi:hypothetical protein